MFLFSIRDVLAVFVEEAAVQNRIFIRAQHSYYCWVGILLACMSILLAGGFGPNGMYSRDARSDIGKSHASHSHKFLLNDLPHDRNMADSNKWVLGQMGELPKMGPR